ncbi:MAG: peptide ABC transporter substrate-binding protein [Firmicutes bacterium]|nr:peptide ABC transporter substrate-binding protein [Bacillota bacterium]
MTRSRLIRALTLVAVVVLALGLGAPGAGAQQRRDTVVIGMAQEPDCLIMAFCQMAAGAAVANNSVFTSMVIYNDKWQLVPATVEKIPTLKDGDWQLLPGGKMKVTYRFRRNFTWHDGKPYTALDASWTYLMLRNPRSPTLSRSVLRKIDNMSVPNPNDPYTLVVQWNERYPFANTGHVVYPKHVMEREYLRDPAGLKAHRQARFPIGNGPYRFVEWVPGSHITLEAYDRYPGLGGVGGPAKIKRQVWRFILDSTVLQANVIANQVDVTEINNFSIDQMLEIERRNPQHAAHYTPALIWEHIDLNLDNEWLRDKRVRQALAHGINREEFSQKLFYGKQPVAHTWLPERHEAFNPQVKKYPYDPARARQLLAEAGFVPGPDGILRDARGRRVELTIMTTAGNAVREQIQQIMKEQLRQIGIDLRIDNRPASVLFGQVTRQRQFPHMVMYAWLMTPESLPHFFWHSNQVPTPQNNWEGSNYPGWRHAENDRLCDAAAQEIDAAKRIELIKRQQEIWAEELPAIPLYFRLSLTTAHKRLAPVKPAGLAGTYINWNSHEWAWVQ